MRTLYFFALCFLISAYNDSYCQPASGKSRFLIKGKFAGRDTGTIILWFNDSNNYVRADTAYLNNGEFSFSGTTNLVCEALLWADPKQIEFDNPSMIRFLLEPGQISIIGKKGEEGQAVIKGSASQIEKQQWDLQKIKQLDAIKSYRKSIDSLYRAVSKDNRGTLFQYQVKVLADKLDSVNKVITKMDVQYITAHTKSYLSAYLLYRQVRKLSVDSIQQMFSNLSAKAKKSSVGHDVLSYVYPKTDDNDFRKANPLVDTKFDERLRNIHSVHDLSLTDTLGNKISLGAFKGKYLVIDFWTSSCGPCIENIPALNAFMRSYSSSDVQFVSISLDRNADAWKRSIRKYKFGGLQLSDLQGFYGLAPVYCKVLWVPGYIIADRNGKIINYKAPHPNEPEFKKQLDGLLNKGQSAKLSFAN